MSTRPTPPRRSRRRAAAVALTGLSIAGVLGLTAEPSAAAVPGAPTAIGGLRFANSVRFYWTQPADAEPGDLYEYVVERSLQTDPNVKQFFIVEDTRAFEDKTVMPGVKYNYRVQAADEDGVGSFSTPVQLETDAAKTDLTPFGGDATVFVERQYLDLLDDADPNAFDVATDAQAVQQGDLSTAAVIDKLANDVDRVALRHPVIRLYEAYFDRAPDTSGLHYWLGKRAGGSKLDVVSAKFAGSSEFKNTYGALDDEAFVELVYHNVLDREADPTGLEFWTDKLEAGTSRGRVMTNFSESKEFKRTSRGVVVVDDLADDMFNKVASTAERAQFGSFVQGGATAGDLGALFTHLPGY